jgi:hypothetical protein
MVSTNNATAEGLKNAAALLEDARTTIATAHNQVCARLDLARNIISATASTVEEAQDAPLTPSATDLLLALLALLEDPRFTLRTEASLLGTLCIDVGSLHTLLGVMGEAYVVRTNRTTGARLIGLARRN